MKLRPTHTSESNMSSDKVISAILLFLFMSIPSTSVAQVGPPVDAMTSKMAQTGVLNDSEVLAFQTHTGTFESSSGELGELLDHSADMILDDSDLSEMFFAYYAPAPVIYNPPSGTTEVKTIQVSNRTTKTLRFEGFTITKLTDSESATPQYSKILAPGETATITIKPIQRMLLRVQADYVPPRPGVFEDELIEAPSRTRNNLRIILRPWSPRPMPDPAVVELIPHL